MPRAREGFKHLSTMVPEAQLDALDALAERTGRSVAQEVAHAIERHLAHPPSVEAPPLPPARAEQPKRKPGRPRKEK